MQSESTTAIRYKSPTVLLSMHAPPDLLSKSWVDYVLNSSPYT